MNSVVRTLEDEKKQLAEILGNKIYAFCMENPETDIPRADVESICQEITNRNTQIEANKQKIADLDAEMNQIMGNTSNVGVVTCQCGHANAIGAKFCAKCGNKLG